MTRAIIEEGLGLRYTFASGAVDFEELAVKPPGAKGSGGKNTTNHANTGVQTKAPGKLPEITDMGGTCHFSKTSLGTIMAQLQVNQSIVVTYPGGGTHTVWGWLEEFIPGDFVANQQPTATFKIIVSNRNASSVETPPVYAAGP